MQQTELICFRITDKEVKTINWYITAHIHDHYCVCVWRSRSLHPRTLGHYTNVALLLFPQKSDRQTMKLVSVFPWIDPCSTQLPSVPDAVGLATEMASSNYAEDFFCGGRPWHLS